MAAAIGVRSDCTLTDLRRFARRSEKWLGLSEQPLTFDKWIVCGLVVQVAACGASWRSGVARPE